ncbi:MULTISPECIES: hypothetical protein [Colwellia]|uniref:Uncharacterized protein n=1 Tax=Colwellia marinimaniae TaxID=1513592 RepID=A0ABQ0MQ38_9GAMM|nr:MULTISPECIES: hypothetical protein [Colwellia]GAW94487.1 hypothetical protein MTCD1_00083 [Colwellia marinimaniae]
MDFTLAKYQLKINKRKIRQGVITLLLFCATFFSHSEHFTQVDFDAFANVASHDCHLCQQGLDSPPSSIRLYPVATSIARLNNVRIISVVLAAPAYINPPLRAPPSSL